MLQTSKCALAVSVNAHVFCKIMTTMICEKYHSKEHVVFPHIELHVARYPSGCSYHNIISEVKELPKSKLLQFYNLFYIQMNVSMM